MAINKTEALLWTQRLHEAIRALPDSVEIYGCETRYDPEFRLEIHLSAPVEWPAVFDGRVYDGWKEKRIAVTPFAAAWWAEYKEADDDDGKHS